MLDPERLEAAARQAQSNRSLWPTAAALLVRLEVSDTPEQAVLDLFGECLSLISLNYFGKEWAPEHEFSVWARLNDDPRAWGYGSEEELAPIRWLVDLTGCWFDGTNLMSVEAWTRRFELWANGQQAMVKRVTPGALEPDPRLDLG